MIKKLSAKIAILRPLRKIVPVETLKLLYYAIVQQPHFDYIDIVYNIASKTDLGQLQKLQNRAARLITASTHKTSRTGMFPDLR